MKTLCIIPVRSGSKRLPDKAILPFAGTTLLEITCRQAIRLKWMKDQLFDDIVFSSDSLSYLQLASESDITDLRHRPPELATDTADSIDVVRDALDWMEQVKSVKYDTVVLLQVTSPLRLDEDITGCIDIYESVSWVHLKTMDDRTTMLNGAVYIWDRDVLVFKKDIIGNAIYMPPERSIDIDTEFDFLVAQFVYTNNLHKV